MWRGGGGGGGGAGLINRMGTNRTSDPALEEKSGTEYS